MRRLLLILMLLAVPAGFLGFALWGPSGIVLDTAIFFGHALPVLLDFFTYLIVGCSIALLSCLCVSSLASRLTPTLAARSIRDTFRGLANVISDNFVPVLVGLWLSVYVGIGFFYAAPLRAGWCDEVWQCGGVSPIVDIPLTSSLTPAKGTTLSSYTRASAATQITGGLLSSVAVNAPRFEDGWFLSEGASQNDILYSEPTSVAQAAADANVTYAAYAWACGLLTRDVVFGDDSAARSITFAATIAATDVWTLSMFVVMDDAGTPVIGPPTTETADLYFSVGDDGGTRGTSTATQLGTSAIWRVSQTITSTDGVDTVTFGKATTNSARGFKAGGFQAEKKAFVSSYIPTAGSAVARASDSPANYTLSQAVKNAMSSAEPVGSATTAKVTIVVDFLFPSTNVLGEQGLLYITDGATTISTLSATGRLFARYISGTQYVMASTFFSANEAVRAVLQTDGATINYYFINKATSATLTGSTAYADPSFTGAAITVQKNGTTARPVKTKKVTFYSKALSPAKITSILNAP